MKFEVPCECGNKLIVTAGDAGSTLGCKCGRTVEVPGLHQLRASVPSSEPAPPAPRQNLSILRIVGPALVIASIIWRCGFRPFPGITLDQLHSLQLPGLIGGLILHSAGVIMWAIGKGYRPLYGLLLVFLGPLGLLMLIVLPSRER